MVIEDLAAFFSDFGVSAEFGGEDAVVLLDMPQEEILSGMQQSSEYAMTYRQGDLPGLKSGDQGMVNGIAYCVRQTSMLDDGKLIKALLER